MVKSLADYVKHELGHNYSLEEIRRSLINKGFLEEDVDRAIYSVTKNIKYEKSIITKKLNKLFGSKEVFDRIAYGLGNQQIVNILFSLAGASFFLIGLANGLKSIVSTLLSSFLNEYNKVHDISKKAIAVLGIVFGLSFMLIAMAVRMESPFLFVIALILGAVGVVGHGDLYRKFLNDNIHIHQRSKFLKKISQTGIIITIFAMLLSGFLLDFFPIDGIFKITILGSEMPLLGYVLVFMGASIMFIISGYLLTFVDEARAVKKYRFGIFFKEHYSNIKKHINIFTKSKVIFLLFFATTVTAAAQILGASYYGIFIYQHFNDSALGGFMNVAVVFVIALAVSFTGPAITKFISKHVGEAPMLVFGTLLVALLHLVIAFNPNILAIGAGVALATIGSAIIGVSQGLMALKILNAEDRKMYFSSLSFVTFIPFIILIPAGSIIAQYFGLQTLYMALGIVLTIIVAPLYFLIVLMANKAELVA